MTQEKQLLLQDLCGRLPYGVIGLYSWKNREPYNRELTGCLFDELKSSWDSTEDSQFLPYLRPMSSMTEEEKKELKFMCDIGPETLTDSSWINGEFGLSVVYKNKASFCVDVIDWLNKKMFDFRGLIPNGLANSTEEFNTYKN
jgi:hypothetical protein